MFALVDCNNFYVSCERIFQPTLCHRPVVVLSNNDGCVIARSEEAKLAGVAMGTPFFQLRDKVKSHNLAYRSSNYALYGDMSARVMTTLGHFTPDLEIYSIDECFLDLRPLRQTLEQSIEYAHTMRTTVRQWTGIPVSIGLAATKTLAKLANRRAKKSAAGVCALSTPEEQEIALRDTEIGDIWGIGRQHAQWFMLRGARTGWDFSQLPESLVRKRMGVLGVRMRYELRGIPCLELEPPVTQRQQIIVSRSFPSDYDTFPDIAVAVATFTGRIGEKLRHLGQRTSAITVFLQQNRFKTSDGRSHHSAATATLPLATSDTGQLLKVTTALVKSLFVAGVAYKKAGIMASDLSTAQSLQTNLFCFNEAHQKREDLSLVMDQLNQRYGKGTVRQGHQAQFTTQGTEQQFKSPCYTTVLEDIKRVKD
jgi:DNA polymerase V